MTVDDDVPEILDRSEKVLGTPSAQCIFSLFSVWERLSVREVVEKAGLSESQVHATLKGLEAIELLVKKARGVYEIAPSSFAQQLQFAYLTRIRQVIGQKLYQITKGLDSLPKKQLVSAFAQLMQYWEPVLDKSFRHQVSSLAGTLLDAS